MARFIVELEVGVWYAEWEGDPGRTLNRRSAQRFEAISAAEIAIETSRKYRPFRGARVVEIKGVDVDFVSAVISPDELRHKDGAELDWECK